MAGKIYLSQKDLKEEYFKSVEAKAATSRLLHMFQKIAKNFIRQYDSPNKIDTDACVNYAVAEAWQKWNKYNPEVSDDIFSFYTTMIANDMKLHYKQINKGKELNISIESLLSNEDK